METNEHRKVPAAARGLCLDIPSDEGRLRILKDDLATMGCLGFLHQPWNLRSDEMIAELLTEAPNQYVFMVRGHPKSWTLELWVEVYFATTKGAGLVERVAAQGK